MSSINISAETAQLNNVTFTGSILQDNSEAVFNDVAKGTCKDSEHVMMELMIASSSIPSNNTTGTTKNKTEKASVSGSSIHKSDVKKRAKQQRDNTKDLSLLLPDSQMVEEEKAFGFAQAYFSKVKDRLNANDFTQFINVLNEFDNRTSQIKVSDLYHNVMSIFKGHPDLSEEFLAFLLPHQAMELGVYMQFLCISKMKHFLRKLEVYFNKQPQQVRKVYECLVRLSERSSTEHVDQATVNNAILPLLKGSTVLTEYFLQLFPCEKPPDTECADIKDFEKVDCVEFDERVDASGVQSVDADAGDWETVVIPDLEDPFGGDNCPCSCHSNVSSSVSSHCFSCGVKFINGRVFIQSGKVLRPAHLVVDGPNKREVINRIMVKDPTDVKEFDDKGGGTVRHRKRPTADSSPVKSNSGHNSGASCALLSPDPEADNFDPKPAKIKSPRGVKGVKVLKSNTNKTEVTNNKDKVVAEKENNVQQAEEDNLLFESFVLLNDIKCSNNPDENAEENNTKETNGNVTIKCEYDEDSDNYIKSKKNANSITSALLPSDCNEVHLIRDDEDDDVEFIDIDDDDDEVDDDCDDIEEDDHHNDDEEEEEEFDVDDIEEVDIDEEFDREIEVDCVDLENSRSSNNNNQELLNEIGRMDTNSEEANHLPAEIKYGSNKSEDVIGPLISNDVIKKEAVEDYEKKEIKVNVTQLQCETGDLRKEFSKDQPSNKNLDIDSTVENTSNSDLKHGSNKISLSFTTSALSDNNSTVKIENAVESSTSTAIPTLPPSTTAHSISWTKEEDKVILQTFQQESDSDQTFMTIRERLPQRSVEEIKSRFHILMLLLKRMTTNKNNSE